MSRGLAIVANGSSNDIPRYALAQGGFFDRGRLQGGGSFLIVNFFNYIWKREDSRGNGPNLRFFRQKGKVEELSISR